MKEQDLFQIIQDTDYVRVCGTDGERRCAEYLRDLCLRYTPDVLFETFPAEVTECTESSLHADGRDIPCMPYMGYEEADIEAPLYFLEARSDLGYEKCWGKAVLATGYPAYSDYEKIVKAGAACIITYTGDYELGGTLVPRYYFFNRKGGCPILPSVVINSRDALSLLKENAPVIRLHVRQALRYEVSQNVVATLPGRTDEYILCTAHYDTTPLSHGSYDNMAGCAALLNLLAEMSKKAPARYGMKFVFTGGEETGQHGASDYCTAHAGEFDRCVLNVNADMLGAAGDFEAVCSADQKLADFIAEHCRRNGIAVNAHTGVYSGDSTRFAECGVPAVTFTRFSPYNKFIAPFHGEDDTPGSIIGWLLENDVRAICGFAETLADMDELPMPRTIPDDILDKIEVERGRREEKNIKTDKKAERMKC